MKLSKFSFLMLVVFTLLILTGSVAAPLESSQVISSNGIIHYPASMEKFGFYLVSWGLNQYPDGSYKYPFQASESEAIFQKSLNDGANSVILYWRVMMENATSNEIHLIHPWATEPDSAIIKAVTTLSSIGYRHIELKPTIYVEDGTWSGEINPSNVSEWFESYKTMTKHYAELAESLTPNVTSLCIGHELKSMLNYETNWREVISEIRKITDLPIGYHAATQEWVSRLITFWDSLDYGAINLYVPLVDELDPTLDEIIDGYSPYVQNVIDWHDERCPDLPIDITACFGAFDGQGMRASREVDSGDVPDVQEQADLMEAFFRVWWNNSRTPFIKSIHYYNLDLLGRGGSPSDPQQYMSALCNDKPVEDVIRNWYFTAP